MVYNEILEISDIIDDIKQNITDNQYKTIMDLLMKINTKKELSNLTNIFLPVYL